MIQNLKFAIARNLRNIKGWSTDRKIIVIESDDWGSIRMPSKEIFDEFVKKGYPLNDKIFEKYDTIANSEDFELLFETLKSISNDKGQNPIITANIVMANPNFKKIFDSEFKNYYYEPFTTTLKNYYPLEDVFSYWQFGLKEKLFFPQFHAREHYNIIKWMQLLQSGSKDELNAFEFNMVGIPSKNNPELGNQLQIAFGIENEKDIDFQKNILIEGLDLFEKIFGFSSKSFIAPVYTWNEELNEILAQKGIQYLQGGKIQKSPDKYDGSIKFIKHFLGKKNSFGQYYLVRNVYFEPSTNTDKDWVNDCFKDVKAAFFWKKPAIISTHRLNYVGGLDENNRKRGNYLLSQLLTKIVEEYPEVEFMTSVELGDTIKESFIK